MPASSIDSSISAVSVTWLPPPWAAITNSVRPARRPSTRSSTSRRGGSSRVRRTRIGSLLPIAETTQEISPDSSTSILETDGGSVRTWLWGSAITAQTASGGAGMERETETFTARSPGGRDRVVLAHRAVQRVTLRGAEAGVSDRVQEVLD